MAVIFHVSGPTQIEIATDIFSTWELFGYTDNDNLPSIQITDHHHEVKTVLSGNVPAEIVLTGTSARITLALVKWDAVILNQMLAASRNVYNTPQVGRVLDILTTAFFGLRITSVSTAQEYTFAACYLQVDGVNDSQWGNRERVLTLNISAIPDSSNNIYNYIN